MARILFSGAPAHGLIQPSFPLVKALTESGHEVDYLTGDSFRSRVERAGAGLIPTAFYLGGAITSPRKLVTHARRLFDDLHSGTVELAPRYDLVVAAGLTPHRRQLEKECAVPVATMLPVFLQNARTLAHVADLATAMPTPARRLLRSPRARRTLGAVAGTLLTGRPVGDPVSLLGPQASPLVLTPSSRYYQPFLEDFEGAPVTYLGPTPTLSVPDPGFPLDRVREHPGPVLYGTLGTVFNTWTPFFTTLIEAFGGTDALLVLTTGRESTARDLGATPDNVILRSFVPQADILAHADICFTHGGFGSATDAVSLGARPIVTPMGADQYFNAYRLAELGAARVLPKEGFTVQAIRSLADEVLADSAMDDHLSRLKASFETAAGPAGGVTALEALLA